MATFQKIQDHADLVRDTRSNAIINTNTDVYYAAKARKRKTQNQNQEIQSLKKEMSEIKSLLLTLINNSK